MIKSTFFTDWKVIFYGTGTLAMAAVITFIGIENSLDSRFYYSFEQASLYMSNLSQVQIDKYLLNEFLDLGLIFFYSSFLYVGFSRLFYKNFLWVKYLGLIPGAFDFIETKFIILYLNKTVEPTIFYWLGSVTAAKWCFGGICFFILSSALLVRLKFFKLTKT